MTAISNGGAAQRVKVLTDADLKANGGQYYLEGRPPVAVYGVVDAETKAQGGQYVVMGNVLQPVYVVDAPVGLVEGNTPIPMIAVDSGLALGFAAIPVYVVGGSLGGLTPVQNLVLEVTGAAFDVITATWDAVPNATDYEIEYSDDGVTYAPVGTTALLTFDIEDTDYNPDAVTHYVRVRAVGGEDWTIASISGLLLNTFSAYRPTGFNDDVGTNDLTENGTVGIVASGLGNAWDFDGSPNYLSHADNAALRLAGSFTIAFRVRIEGNQNYKTIIGKWSDANNGNYGMWVASDTADQSFILPNDAGGNTTCTIASILAADTWHTVIATYDSVTNEMIYLINNSLSDTETFTGTRDNAATDEFRVGRDPGGQYLIGQVQMLMLCNRAWSTAQKTAYYNGGAGFDPLA